MEDMAYQRSRDLLVRLETSRGITARNWGHIHNYVYKPKGFHAKTSDWIGSRESLADGVAGVWRSRRSSVWDRYYSPGYKAIWYVPPSTSSLTHVTPPGYDPGQVNAQE
jgi:hypothetical protein